MAYRSKIVVGDTYVVEPTEILPFGVKVFIPSINEHSFIHISNIIPGFCKNINDYVVVGESYTAWAVEGKVKPIELRLYSDDSR